MLLVLVVCSQDRIPFHVYRQEIYSILSVTCGIKSRQPKCALECQGIIFDLSIIFSLQYLNFWLKKKYKTLTWGQKEKKKIQAKCGTGVMKNFLHWNKFIVSILYVIYFWSTSHIYQFIAIKKYALLKETNTPFGGKSTMLYAFHHERVTKLFS